MKTCFKCGRALPLGEFYRHPMMADGHLGKCKDCTKRDVRENYHSRRSHYLEYDQARAMRPDRVALRRKYPERDKARVKARAAVRSGKLTKLPCRICGSSKSEMHHPNYSEPLNVLWFCRRHHGEHHREAN